MASRGRGSLPQVLIVVHIGPPRPGTGHVRSALFDILLDAKDGRRRRSTVSDPDMYVDSDLRLNKVDSADVYRSWLQFSQGVILGVNRPVRVIGGMA